MQSDYVFAYTEKSKCPSCDRRLVLLQDKRIRVRVPMFFICWTCQRVSQVGKGEVLRETQY
jgi:hypothetical protein